MSYNQPGPYGQQPPQGPQPGQPGAMGVPPMPGGYGGQQPPQGPPQGGANPYAQGGAAPGGPGYGYPPQYPQQPQPQQPGAPYGAPQQPGPYQQQPAVPGQYPGQQPYPGQPQQPYHQAPGSGGGSGKKAGVAIAVIVALAAVGGGLWFVLSGGNESIAADDGTRYDLVLPETTGDFSKIPGEEGEQVFEEKDLEKAGLQDMEQVSAMYMNTDPEAPIPEPGTVVMGAAGLYGEVDNPQQTVDLLFAEAARSVAEDGDIELLGTAESFTTEEAAMKCQQGKETEADEEVGYAVTLTLCLWADYSTVGATYFVPYPELPLDFDPTGEEAPELKEPEPVGVSKAADITKQLRKDSLQERGGE
ncbi:hypothetical protein [Streptomyces sp. YIM 98790]|uniref:hypothetical protein n=1 Tax=Streptomyces sp. YIM 98790 TaxID=2689077 RepID=UPI001407E20F|nr:hypothetical protein [Streptomyces sp. YIM 98790]